MRVQVAPRGIGEADALTRGDEPGRVAEHVVRLSPCAVGQDQQDLVRLRALGVVLVHGGVSARRPLLERFGVGSGVEQQRPVAFVEGDLGG